MNNVSLIFKSVFISDLHLGTSDAQSDALYDFIRTVECDDLYLVGDIIDGWALKRQWKWTQTQSDFLQKLLRKARKGTRIHYITGNHDEFLLPFLPMNLGDRITITEQAVHKSINGKSYLVTHGDMFDTITMTKKWVAHLGDRCYLFLLKLNRPINILENG